MRACKFMENKNQAKEKKDYNYFDVKTRKRFYCSQLVWAAFKDRYKIDMNTSLFGKAVHPMELVNSPETYACYMYRK